MFSVIILVLAPICQTFGYHSDLDFSQDEPNNTEISLSTRESRNMFPIDTCQTTQGFKGTCMTRLRCMQRKGVASGFCGTYGVCCETNLQCSQTSKQKSTIIRNPAQVPNECAYIIDQYSPNVCQLRIDFEIFQLAQPILQTTVTGLSAAYICSNYFNVNGITLCGNNDGQHIFVPFNVGDGIDHVQLKFVNTNRSAPANWRLLLTQLECPATKQRSLLNFMPFNQQNNLLNMKNLFGSRNIDYEQLAPVGCLQYHIAQSGSIESFNYNNGLGPYMTSMSYAICFKRKPGNSILEFTSERFILPNQGANGGYDSDCHGTVLTLGKQKDYLMIPGAMMDSIQSAIQPTYFCGLSLDLNKVVYTAADGPFVIYFMSDENSVVGQDVGFRLNYQIRELS